MVEFNSCPEFDFAAVTQLMNQEQPLDFSKYCNKDLHLLKTNMTPYQFESIDNDTFFAKNKKATSQNDDLSIGAKIQNLSKLCCQI